MRTRPYESVLREVFRHGTKKTDRTGVGTRSLPGRQIVYNLKRFPLLWTKRVGLRLIALELFWFLRGYSNIQDLVNANVHIWDEFADSNGELGPVYGVQWRHWPGPDGKEYDQIDWVMGELRDNPDSRRLVVSAWNVAELDKMALQPCHMTFQFYVADGKLSIIVTQRSADMFLGVPFNIASYALLTYMVAHQLGLGVGYIIWNGGDVHIYDNHVKQVKKQLRRWRWLPRRRHPKLRFKRMPNGLEDYTWEDIELIGYKPYSTIKAQVAVGPTFVTR